MWSYLSLISLCQATLANDGYHADITTEQHIEHFSLNTRCSILPPDMCVTRAHLFSVTVRQVFPNSQFVLNATHSIHTSAKPHDDVIKWKHFPVNSPHKGQWRGALMLSFTCVWINGWVNNREAGDLRRHRAHYDVIVMNYKITYIIILKPEANRKQS